ncbi:hypothetical protein BaRGS_00030665, partial [Batillaria attramentaria]
MKSHRPTLPDEEESHLLTPSSSSPHSVRVRLRRYRSAASDQMAENPTVKWFAGHWKTVARVATLKSLAQLWGPA